MSEPAYDLFVSYAHSDDEIPAGARNGWVTTLVEELNKVLRRKLVVAASDDKTARLWACRVCAPASALIADIRQQVKRPLSPQERLASDLSVVVGSPGQ